MSEGEGGYRPPSIDNTKSRRTFLKDMLKVGAGVAALAAGTEILPGQQPTTAKADTPTTETTLPTNVEPALEEKDKKSTLFEADSTEFKSIGTKFQVLADPNVSDKDIRAVQRLPFMQIGSTATSVADELIKRAQSGENLTPQQMDAINRAFVEAELKVFQVLYPQNSAP